MTTPLRLAVSEPYGPLVRERRGTGNLPLQSRDYRECPGTFPCTDFRGETSSSRTHTTWPSRIRQDSQTQPRRSDDK